MNVNGNESASMNAMEKENLYSSGVYPKIPLEIVKGEGLWLWDSSGRKYLDMISSLGVTALGNSNPEWVKAVTRQMEMLPNSYNSFYNEVRADYLEKLSKLSPKSLNRTFLCNSGTESVEAALKFARMSTGRKEFISFNNAFHGRSLGALSATWKNSFKQPFQPLVSGFDFAEFNNIDSVREKINENTAGIIVELVQGEGGIIPAEKEFVNELKEICSENELLLIVDEVQTGFGKTGKMFASQHYNLEPDILCLGKSIGNGFPMGAAMFNDKIKSEKKMHGSTFGGNPMACAAGNATIDIIEKENLLENAREIGNYLMEGLNAIESNAVKEVRGLGLMIGIDLRARPASFLKGLAERQVLACSAGLTVLRLLPALNISREEADFALERIKEVLSD